MLRTSPGPFAVGAAAQARGASFRRGEVRVVRPLGDGVRIEFTDGTVLTAGTAVIAAGGWSRPLTVPLPNLSERKGPPSKVVPKGPITYEKVSKSIKSESAKPLFGKLGSLFGGKKDKDKK